VKSHLVPHKEEANPLRGEATTAGGSQEGATTWNVIKDMKSFDRGEKMLDEMPLYPYFYLPTQFDGKSPGIYFPIREIQNSMRRSGLEPEFRRWQRLVITTTLSAQNDSVSLSVNPNKDIESSPEPVPRCHFPVL
jgi:hypothetical protein